MYNVSCKKIHINQYLVFLEGEWRFWLVRNGPEWFFKVADSWPKQTDHFPPGFFKVFSISVRILGGLIILANGNGHLFDSIIGGGASHIKHDRANATLWENTEIIEVLKHGGISPTASGHKLSGVCVTSAPLSCLYMPSRREASDFTFSGGFVCFFFVCFGFVLSDWIHSHWVFITFEMIWSTDVQFVSQMKASRECVSRLGGWGNVFERIKHPFPFHICFWGSNLNVKM